MCVTICGRFYPDEGVVAGYDNRIWVKYTAKWGAQIAGMFLGHALDLRQSYHKRAASPDSIFHLDTAMMQRHNLFCNAKPKSKMLLVFS